MDLSIDDLMNTPHWPDLLADNQDLVNSLFTELLCSYLESTDRDSLSALQVPVISVLNARFQIHQVSIAALDALADELNESAAEEEAVRAEEANIRARRKSRDWNRAMVRKGGK